MVCIVKMSNLTTTFYQCLTDNLSTQTLVQSYSILNNTGSTKHILCSSERWFTCGTTFQEHHFVK